MSYTFVWQGGAITELEPLPDGTASSFAQGINDRGEIVGFGARGFLWRHGAVTELELDPRAINNRGQIVGGTGLWQDGAITFLPDLVGGGPSYANAINERGQVAGAGFPASGDLHAVIWQGGNITDLGTLPGDAYSYAWSINDRGAVVGAGERHAILWQNGTITDLGILPGGFYSVATAINARGQIVGYGTTASGYGHAVIWQGGNITDLGTLPGATCPLPSSTFFCSQALGINDRGQIVGFSFTAAGDVHAVLWQVARGEDEGD